ncbi:MAG: SDR family oxidoreductase [Acidimicrobiia bacterium]|nr:SDR family oxidoreductase [Acidimicrobiia bacterium]
MSDLFGIEGKVAIVTGGSRGIGYMIAEGLVANGVRTYITSRKAADCDAAAAELSKVGECTSIPADLASEEGMGSFVSAFGEREPELHILVNNAGAAWGAPLGDFPAAGFDKVMNINVRAPFLLTQALLPRLEAAASPEDPSRVIMIGSIDGFMVPHGDNFSYSASKAAVHMLARHLAHNVVGDNVTVNTVAPGPFRSKMMGYLLDDPDSRARVAKVVPRKRIGTPEDVAGAVIYLSSRAGAWLTGVLIPVDGGLSTHG